MKDGKIWQSIEETPKNRVYSIIQAQHPRQSFFSFQSKHFIDSTSPKLKKANDLPSYIEKVVNQSKTSKKESEESSSTPGYISESKVLVKKREIGKSIQITPDITIDRVISFVMYVFLICTGIYVALFGFRIFRLLMVILGFYISYYFLLFSAVILKIYNAYNVTHQLGLFFLTISCGFILSICCHLFKKINYIIFGIAISCGFSLFYAQFFVDFEIKEEVNHFMLFFSSIAILFSLISAFFIESMLIVGSAFIGSSITLINFGVVFSDFKSFEERLLLPDDNISDFWHYTIACVLFIFLGTGIQFYLQKRVKRNERNLELDMNNSEIDFEYNFG